MIKHLVKFGNKLLALINQEILSWGLQHMKTNTRTQEHTRMQGIMILLQEGIYFQCDYTE